MAQQLAIPKRDNGQPSARGLSGDKVIPRLTRDQEANLLTFTTMAQSSLINQMSLRSTMLEIDRAYMREMDYTEEQWQARLKNRVGDTSKIQNVTVPIVMPQVESALTYYLNVFLTGYPIFGVVSDPTNENAALMMNTLMGENQVTAGWARQLQMFFRDGLKYNLHGLEVEWVQKAVPSVDNDVTARNGAKPKKILWQGNAIRRLDLYNTFFDPRVHPAEIHEEGEYAGYLTVMSRVRLKKYIANMINQPDPDVVNRAMQTGPGIGMGGGNAGSPSGYYLPMINPFPLMANQNVGGYDWASWFAGAAQNDPNNGVRYNNVFEVMKIYIRMIPADYGLNVPEAKTPQVWKLIIINNTVILSYERVTDAHDWIPMFFGQPLEDGLDYQTKSFASNVTDMQSVASALMSSFLAGRRRTVTDRMIYDPSKIRKSDIASTDPTAKIPVRPSHYGKPLGEAVYQIPFRDDQSPATLNGVQLVTNQANLINGQNPADQGQFTPGNRTEHEYADIMSRGNGKNQAMTIMTENQVFVPVKECLKLNILQYQQATQKYNPSTKQPITIDPVTLRKQAIVFKVVDGLTPEDKIIGSDDLQSAFQLLGQDQALGAAYKRGPMFTYMMSTRNLDLTPFEKSPAQLDYEQQQQQWQQVAMVAIQKGVAFNTPQPQPSPQLQQEMQAAQQNGGVLPGSSVIANALQTVTGDNTGNGDNSNAQQ